MVLDRTRISGIFETIGAVLREPTSLCLIGSTPAIMLGQPARQTQDIDVWKPASSYDTRELARACEAAGLLFDPTGEVAPEVAYLQIVAVGPVSLPPEIEMETIARFGQLTVAMPAARILAAAKLTRGLERDLEDVAWWIRQRALTTDDLGAAIGDLPRPADRETAAENMILVELVSGREPR